MTTTANKVTVSAKIHEHASNSNVFAGSQSVLKAMYMMMLKEEEVTLLPQRIYQRREGDDTVEAGVVYAVQGLEGVATITLDWDTIGRMTFADGNMKGLSLLTKPTNTSEKEEAWNEGENAPTITLKSIKARTRNENQLAYPLASYKDFETWTAFLAEDKKEEFCHLAGKPTQLDPAKFDIFNARVKDLTEGEKFKAGTTPVGEFNKDAAKIKSALDKGDNVVFPTLSYTAQIKKTA